MRRGGNKQRRSASRGGNGFTVDFQELSDRADGLFRFGYWAIGAIVLAGAVSVGLNDSQWLIGYLTMTVSSAALYVSWVLQAKRGLPLLPLFVVQQLVIYATPLLVRNPSIAMYQPTTVSTAGVGIMLFLSACGLGWFIGKNSFESKGSRWNLGLAEGRDASARCLSLSFLLLGAGGAFHLSVRTGLISQLLVGPLEGVFPIVRTFADAASMLGGMLGAIVIGGKPGSVRSWAFWILVLTIGLLSIADVLISAASGLVIAVTIGLAFGLRRLPWRFLLVTFGLIGFLNQGKFLVRERYWTDESNSTGLGLFELPAFYAEWASASSSILWGEVEVDEIMERRDLEEGQSIFERVNNLQNLTYVLEVMKAVNIAPLEGETYTLIPKLLIPRFVWKDKPRAHEGQVLLNLHFGRQFSVEQTEKTYIAWGLLPEAVGNFGPWWGPLLVGGILGLMIGLLEQWSLRVRLFSVEGILLMALLLTFASSYEMVASVFVTSSFQFLIASAAGGFLIYHWFGHGRQGQGKGRRKSPIAMGPARFTKLSRDPADYLDHDRN